MSIPNQRRFSIGRLIRRGILILLIILALWNVIWRISNNQAVARFEAAARKRGEPVTVRELAAAYPRVADTENIHRALVAVWSSEDPAFWTAYMNGTRPLPAQQDEKLSPVLPLVGDGKQLVYTNELSAAQIAAIGEFLSEKKAHMDAVRAALRLKLYSANYNFDDGYAMLLPELAKLKREAQFFTLEVLDAIAAEDNPRAIAAIADVARVGHCLKADPLLIGQLVRIACYNIAISDAERLLKYRQLSDAENSQLVAILHEMKQDHGIKQAMIGERAFAWSLLDGSPEQLAAISSPGPGDEVSSPGDTAFGFRMMRWAGMAGADKRLMGETYDQTIRCLDKPGYAATDELHDIFATMEQKARSFPPKIMTMMLMPALQKSGEKAARIEALRRCALTALAIEHYRELHNGALPPELSALGAAALEDPFTGKPLLLKSTAHGYTVYSVGPDRQDDDAQLIPPNSSSYNRQVDIGFKVERPPQNDSSRP
jgi:hypothetical protein